VLRAAGQGGVLRRVVGVARGREPAQAVRLPLTVTPMAATPHTTALWSEFHRPLRSFLAKRVRRDVDVDDLVQEVFVRIHRRIDDLERADRVDAWIFQIARNALIDFERVRATRSLTGAGELEVDALVAHAEDGEASQLAGCLRPMIARLPEPYREAVRLIELDRLGQAAAAARLELSRPAMKSRVQRGRLRLKKMLLACCHVELDARGGVMDYHPRAPAPRRKHRTQDMDKNPLPVVVIGGGPVGLAAAAQLVTRDLPALVLEAGGDVAANVRDWGHVRLFSPWRYNVDKAAARLLEAAGWQPPPADALPTGAELVADYLRPLARVPELEGRVRYGVRVVAVTRLGVDKVRTEGREERPFVVRLRDASGDEDEVLARAVIDATGTWATPNPLGAAGLPALGEGSLGEHIHYGIPDVLGAQRARHAGRRTLVVGAGHSAANSILALAELAREHPDTRIVWATRGEDLTRVFGGGDADGLPARGRLGAELAALVDRGKLRLLRSFRVVSLRRSGSALEVVGLHEGREVVVAGVDAVIAATGQRPDLSLTRELRLSLDPLLESAAALAPLIDPNVHSCGTVRAHGAAELAHPERDFYVIGSKSYGRAPTFLLATGYEQARSVAAMLAGDREAATRVELDLPETGVCSASPPREDAPDDEDQAGGCCGPTPRAAAPAEPGGSCCGPAPRAAASAAASCCG
jgi:RNA polymerase sigma factor (SigZ family)